MMIDNEKIGESSTLEEPFINIVMKFFRESVLEQLVKDDIMSQYTGHEKVLPKL